jgi:Fe-S oxidoreductase
MSANVHTGHPDLDGIRASIQGLAHGAARGGSDEARVARAKAVMLREIDGQHAMYLESCIRCGMCAEACHFYQGTGTPEYTPIYKAEPVKRFYRRELGPMRWLRRLYTPDLTIRDLEKWQPLAYDACTECGRCDLICPMGIQISPLIAIMRRALAAADLLPAEIQAVADEQREHGTVFGVGRDAVRELAARIEARGTRVPVDQPKAQLVVLTSAVDVKGFPSSLEALATILNRAGADWTLLSDSVELIGTGESLREINVRRLVEEVLARGATGVILPECGHAYPALRFDSAHMIGEPVPFQVWSAVEYVGRAIQEGRVTVKKGAAEKVTYHDPCKIGRHGGVFDEPRAAIAALGLDLKEMESHARTNFCCGGGGGQFLIERAAPLRARAFEIKMREADDTGASAVLTACNSCRLNYLNGAENANWKMPVRSVVELVAANLQ